MPPSATTRFSPWAVNDEWPLISLPLCGCASGRSLSAAWRSGAAAMDRRRLGGPRLPPLLFILGCLGLIVYPTEAKITSSTWKLADDDDGKGLDDDVPSFSDALGAWTVVNSGKSCYTATKVLEGVGLRMCPLISAQPLDFSGEAGSR